ncbi:MAG: 5'-methylthioadenosine/S-adenosylhomocysteine nucleosidase [Anaerolineaceae bacterium]|jgi:adenosylhomocysteine nucleosidase
MNPSKIDPSHATAVVLISATAEWNAVLAYYHHPSCQHTPFGECFYMPGASPTTLFVQGGWGKIAAAASAQYTIDHWQPRLVVNLGTCGGLAGSVQRGTVLLVEETLVYDIIEQMGDAQEAIRHYTTPIDLSWLQEPYPQQVQRARLVSADRDIVPADIPQLRAAFDAIASDWESGAIAWVAARNNVHCLILRTVSDLVDEQAGEVYGNFAVFEQRTQEVMNDLLAHLPAWLALAGASSSQA